MSADAKPSPKASSMICFSQETVTNSKTTPMRTASSTLPTHSRYTSTDGLWVSVFSGRPPSVQFCYPQHASPPPGCSFSAPSRHARYAGAAPVEGVLAKMINIYANTGAKMAADLQVFSSDSLFSRLPATVATTPCNTSIAATHS